MAGSSVYNNLRKVAHGLVVVSSLAIAGCGTGDGPTSIENSPVTPLPELPAGFCDPINFELLCGVPEIINFNGGATEVVDNPDRSGINDTETVARMQKFGDQPFGGSRINPFEVPVDFSGGAVFRMKVWSERSVPVTFKLEERNDGVGGVERVQTHTGGSEWQELCFDFTGNTVNTIGLTIIFDNGVLGAAIAGVFAGDWTFYYDEILQTDSCGNAGPSTGMAPEVSLYDPDDMDGPDLEIGTDYTEITPFGSGSVINDMFADDATFSPVIAVSSGAGYGANVAQIGFIGFDPGFLTFYDEITFKVKDLPNSVVFVRLFDNVDSVRLNLTSSGFATALDNDWFEVTVPLSNFAGLTTATGIVFESDNTAPEQFTMLLNDIGFSEASMSGGGSGGGGSGGGGSGGGGSGGGTSGLAVFSETNTTTTVTLTNIAQAGNPVTIDSMSTAVMAFDGAVSLGLTYTDNTAGNGFGGAIFEFDNEDLSAFDTLRFAIDTSAFANFANLTVQLEPPGGGTAGGNVSLASYTPVSTSGNWDIYEIPLADFTAVTLTTVNRLGFFNARNGADALIAGTLYLDDIQFVVAGGSGGGSGGGGGSVTAVLGVFSETNTSSEITLTNIAQAGNPVTIDSMSTAVTPFDGTISLGLTYSDNTAGNNFGGAIFEFDDEDLSAFNTLKFAIDTSAFANFANLTVQLEPPGGGTAGGNVSLASYTPVSTTGNWEVYEIPLADFTAVTLTTVNRLGFFNARDGGDVLLNGTLYLDDIHFAQVSSGGTGGGSGGGSGGGGSASGLVPDGGFEVAGTGGLQAPWLAFANGGTVSVSNVNANGGSFAARLQAAPTGGSASFPILKLERVGAGTVTAGQSITINFDVLDADTAGVGKVFVLELFSELADPPGGATNEVLTGAYDLTDSWASRSFTTNVGADVTNGISVIFKADCGGNTACNMDVFIDNVSITLN
ncbi:MAG: hypothetical protein AAGI27_13775 [Pseudomonadota bacterium]